MTSIKVNELFSGIGSQRQALKRLGINHEIIGISEIDKYAIKSYEAIYGSTRNYGDISKVEKLDYADFWTYSSPCQDFSICGKQQGAIRGKTRSGLLYEVQRLLNVAKENNELPKYLMLENVKNLVGKKFKAQFDLWLSFLNELGYNNYWQILNAKDYGIPQNRERVFVISIRKDIDTGKFEFPKKIYLKATLKDLLEYNADEKYNISKVILDRLQGNLNNKFLQENTTDFQDKQVMRKYGLFDTPSRSHQAGSVYDIQGISPTLNTMQGGYRQPCIEYPQHDSEIVINKVIGSTQKNAYVGDGTISPTLTCAMGAGGGNTPMISIADNYHVRIRKLTPLECWRLMGQSDEDFYKVKKVGMSDTQLYKQAGNSIVVNVLVAIFTSLKESQNFRI